MASPRARFPVAFLPFFFAFVGFFSFLPFFAFVFAFVFLFTRPPSL